MKKTLLLLTLIVLSISLCACSSSNDTSNYEESVEENIESEVRSTAAVECLISYKDVKNTLVDCSTIDDNGDGTYDVKGYVTIIDAYGDKYKGKFDAVVSVDDSGEADCTEFNLETPRKV